MSTRGEDYAELAKRLKAVNVALDDIRDFAREKNLAFSLRDLDDPNGDLDNIGWDSSSC